MTTDFLLTVDKGKGIFEVDRTIKMKDKLLDERVFEKFEIERDYWECKGNDWGIVTEEKIDKTMARNISYIHDYFDIRRKYLSYKQYFDIISIPINTIPEFISG